MIQERLTFTNREDLALKFVEEHRSQFGMSTVVLVMLMPQEVIDFKPGISPGGWDELPRDNPKYHSHLPKALQERIEKLATPLKYPISLLIANKTYPLIRLPPSAIDIEKTIAFNQRLLSDGKLTSEAFAQLKRVLTEEGKAVAELTSGEISFSSPTKRQGAPMSRRAFLFAPWLLTAGFTFGRTLSALKGERYGDITLELSPKQKEVLVEEFEFFAKRYAPELTPSQKVRLIKKIGVQLFIPSQRPKSTWTKLSLSWISLSVSALGYGLYYLIRLTSSKEPLKVDREDFLLAVTAMSAGFFTWWLSFFSGLMAGGRIISNPRALREFSAYGGREITLNYKLTKQLDPGPGFRKVIIHELIHLFGSSEAGLHKIRKDAWLANAYSVVRLLHLGGLPLLKLTYNELYGRWATEQKFIKEFLAGIYLYGSLKNADLREKFLISHLRRLVPDIRYPEFNFDTNINLEFVWTYIYGRVLGAIAWMVAKGDVELALHYLDLRDQGLSPQKAETLIQQELKNKPAQPNPESIDLLLKEAKEKFPDLSAIHFNDFESESSLKSDAKMVGLLLGGLLSLLLGGDFLLRWFMKHMKRLNNKEDGSNKGNKGDTGQRKDGGNEQAIKARLEEIAMMIYNGNIPFFTEEERNYLSGLIGKIKSTNLELLHDREKTVSVADRVGEFLDNERILKLLKIALSGNILSHASPEYIRANNILKRITSTNKIEQYPLVILKSIPSNDPGVQGYAWTGDFIELHQPTINSLNDDELAFLLAHEIAHLVMEHTKKRFELEISIMDYHPNLNDFKKMFWLDAEISAQGFEEKADLFGFDYASKAGFNVKQEDIKIKPAVSSPVTQSTQSASSAVKTKADTLAPPAVLASEEYGGIDLSQIELTLKDEKFISSLNPAERKILLAGKYLKEGWYSLCLLYVHETMLLFKDNLIKEIQNRDLLFHILKQLQIKEFLDPQALNFLNFLYSQKPLLEIRVALYQ